MIIRIYFTWIAADALRRRIQAQHFWRSSGQLFYSPCQISLQVAPEQCDNASQWLSSCTFCCTLPRSVLIHDSSIDFFVSIELVVSILDSSWCWRFSFGGRCSIVLFLGNEVFSFVVLSSFRLLLLRPSLSPFLFFTSVRLRQQKKAWPPLIKYLLL